ncbi:mandelate racemase/muconate lactonizing enzyme family protein [Microbaculum marinum]|uniref:Mandelate racemase/muconate lactonizing enzyme family protein n=1 Tax=Microbaculum marinum TaxID=1764581 RepID=A0AAW9RU13_9HYPH
MRITDVLAHPMEAERERPAWTAHESFHLDRLILVEVRTDEGIVGTGEIAIGPQASVCEMVDLIATVIKGQDPLGHAALWQRMLSVTNPRPGGIGGWDGLPPPLPRHLRQFYMAAMAGIDIAIWDIKGKAAGLPVFRLLGGTRTEVFTYGVGGFYVEGGPLLAVADEFAGYVENGFRAVKLKAGALSLDDEIARVRAVREAIGPDVLFMLDVNAPFDLEAAIAYSHAVEPFDIFWFEEPLHWYLQPADFVNLAKATNIPLAHGEREMHRLTTRDFIDSGAIRYIMYDSTRYGGFTEALRVSHYAEQKGVSNSPHSAPHIHAHLVSAFAESSFAAECVGDKRLHPIHERIYGGGARYRDGHVHLTEAPGFGLDIDWDAVRALRSQ